ncbi:hypothetical protein DW352_05370 [Pseudolabrys taiwanensis]|uniref:LTXXQ motif family protein n=1 Tax=Pseudolabrys taiwanensis TaxID=331696 RepID=A0A345ZSV2_9HYPH|nr:Spy/CpxP family protein refolding chaperone [Pseudolabrys taiwanensis]AXK79999.1 hypothetical protein DW352_05370 [Pseudolabrys taiwanensis]
MRISVTAAVLAASLATGGIGLAVRAAANDGVALPAKDQARLPSSEVAAAGHDYGTALIQLAQVARPQLPEGARPMPPDAGMRPMPAGPMREDGEPFGPPPPMARHRPQPLPPTRAACEERMARHAAMVGYIKSKLQLQGAQKDAWRKIEDAADPAVAKLHQICALLPVQPGPPPALPDAIEFAGKQSAARAELLQAVSGPMRALYDTLSADQKAALVPPMPRLHGPF